MKRLLVLVALLVAPFLFAGEDAEKPEPWKPKKGETIYVSATLVWHSGGGFTPFGFVPISETEIPPCVSLEIRKIKPKREYWIVRDPLGGLEVLRGPWLPRMHRTATACGDHFKEAGEPKIVRHDYVHQIVSQED